MRTQIRVVDNTAILTRENYIMFILFFFSAAIVYFTPQAIQRIYFFILLVQFYRSKTNYFWFAFAFLLMVAPSGFFSGSLSSDTQRIPIYSFGKGLSFSFFDLFYLVAILKSIFTIQASAGYYFRSSLRIVVFYAGILLLYSYILGMGFSTLILIGRTTLLPFLFFIFASRLLNTSEDFVKLFKLLLPFIFLSFIGQVYSISFGRTLISIVKTSASTVISNGAAIAEGSDEIARVFDASYLNTLSIIFCCFFLIRSDGNFKPSYLITIIFLNFIICFTSATRGIFLTYTMTLAALTWFILKSSAFRTQYIKYLGIGLVVIILGRIALSTSNTLSTQIDRAEQRIGTLSILFGGDVTLEGNNKRLEDRIPKMMVKIKENPILGWGFSDEGMEYQDGHIGLFNMTREGGILELLVFTLFMFQIAAKPRALSRSWGLAGSEKSALSFIGFAFLTILVDHATSTQMFGYFLGFEAAPKWMLVSLILLGMNAFYRQSELDIANRIIQYKNANNHPLRRNGNPPA